MLPRFRGELHTVDGGMSCRDGFAVSWGWLRAAWHTAAIPLGWLFATVGIAGVLGLLKKD